MKSSLLRWLAPMVIIGGLAIAGSAWSAGPGGDYQRARYDPIHFKPAIDAASDEQCLRCHGEVLQASVRSTSPAGVRADASRAWYQQLGTYTGTQDTFHRRHRESELARSLMKLACNSCHQGHDPRDEHPLTSATSQREGGFNFRKLVSTQDTCLKCHGQMSHTVMGLPEPWPKSREMFQNNCLMCHAAIRTQRHQVSYLNAAAIEQAGAANSDVCWGCHGGRAWYRIPYPYARNAWPGMDAAVPEWATQRPTQSEARFRLPPAAATKPP